MIMSRRLTVPVKQLEPRAKKPKHNGIIDYCFTNFFSSSSSETPFVSGTFRNTQKSCNTIMNAKKAKIGHGLSLNIPSWASKKTGVSSVMKAANIQCTLAPKDCPIALTLLGNISEIKTQITAPCPIACAAIKSNKNVITTIITTQGFTKNHNSHRKTINNI